VNETLADLVAVHEKEKPSAKEQSQFAASINGDASLFFRIALSCLADGDHTDTAIHYREQEVEEPVVELLPSERLASLDRYVKTLETDSDRSRLRSEVYLACRDADLQSSIVSCDSPVGTGKTTAVMAHLLSYAAKRKLRRIIVILPFTNIITQSVQVYREALTLPGENKEHVVAELHHRADFQNKLSRQFTALWKAPIVVTTAVAFFETLASNTPATLRRFHNLPGSAVFIDESHAALPAKLLPLSWRWIKSLGKEWGCYWVLASGSLNRFWKIEEFDKAKPDIPEILPDLLRNRLSQFETHRITYQFNNNPMGANEFVEWATSLPGPRIVILNTVQSAAVIALECRERFGRSYVEHLSTALTPNDREKTLKRIKGRLTNASDTDWTLVATSCVEAGVDLSFKTGVREAASLVSLLQTAGRVNRHDCITSEAVWTIILKEEDLLKKHPGMSDSSKVLVELLAEGNDISPDLCTSALKREIRLAGMFSDELLKLELGMQFPQVEKKFRVIDANTLTAIVDEGLIKNIESYTPVDWQEIQKTSVQIWSYRLQQLGLPEIPERPGVYKWIYAYDDFIGYMAGMLFIERFNKGDPCII
jgi:CRISPR/Cas system-associated endonuclease/helicase Cas3